ncbi:hypothetical protein HBB16_14125 [Pseudonocardia sp. MCCB 268]|nr:hypothetical protein [Pseudonocardia cytotoxica]
MASRTVRKVPVLAPAPELRTCLPGIGGDPPRISPVIGRTRMAWKRQTLRRRGAAARADRGRNRWRRRVDR